MINPDITVEWIRDQIRSKTLTLFGQYERTDDAEMREYFHGQIESYMYLMSSIDPEVFEALSADLNTRRPGDNWTDDITGGGS